MNSIIKIHFILKTFFLNSFLNSKWKDEKCVKNPDSVMRNKKLCGKRIFHKWEKCSQYSILLNNKKGHKTTQYKLIF